ncbi:SGNH/GDSL hydrolase family protein [Nannocystis punicea]|uniref:SGNH/GDSL hydrolase family protein n=1 Tax=Nannocystis punicea TaxID=2995304 RepID=A0ABY7GSX1_9BACT|nr:SGNH/GDSL hydrolase family protein [Nannocystis poenicansa]WAS90048.1 SGNH/GDSL hydrolase family protein [Nannocystis poenicansa]
MTYGTMGPRFNRRATIGALALTLAAAGCDGGDDEGDGSDARWVAAWGTSMMEPGEVLEGVKSRSFSDETLRQTITVTASGDRVRLRISNLFGSRPLVLAEVRVAKELEPQVTAPESERPVHFAGKLDATIPAAAEALSDGVDLEVSPGDRLIVSIYASEPSELATWHPFSFTTHAVAKGNQAASQSLTGPSSLSSGFWLAGVDVESAATDRVVVTFGDSITDGSNSTVDARKSYPDRLFVRLQEDPETRSVAVVNHGLGGNRLLRDSLGPSGLSRFERDVLGTPGVTHAIVLIGINDIGMPGFSGPSEKVTADELIDGLESLADEARAKGVKAFVGTIMPFEDAFPPYYTIEGEEIRQAVNTWIRDNDAYDGVVDFEAAVRDPEHPTRVLAAFDSGDHLHPNDAGHQAMADAVPLSIFK